MTRDELNEAFKKTFGKGLDETTTEDLEGILTLVRDEAAIRAILDEIARRDK